jgi:hypothetical protein
MKYISKRINDNYKKSNKEDKKSKKDKQEWGGTIWKTKKIKMKIFKMMQKM